MHTDGCLSSATGAPSLTAYSSRASQMIKTHGFNLPGAEVLPQHPRSHRLHDGSQTIAEDLLASLDTPQMTSPFYSQPTLPPANTYITSPHSTTSEIPFGSSPTTTFPGGFNFQFSGEHREPPINFSPPGDDRARSQSSKSLEFSKGHMRAGMRKLSMNESVFQNQQRGRPAQLHPRAMSQSQGDMYRSSLGLGIGLETHHEGQTTDPMSMSTWYGMQIPRRSSVHGYLEGYNNSSGAPPLVSGSLNSDDAILDR
jgi:hypothetical protein